jgi:hypothetical protein
VKRTFWAMVGAGFGFGMSFWTMRAVRRLADRYLPAALLERLQRTLDGLDGGTGTRRPSAAGGRELPAWSSPGGPHPSMGGLRALVGGNGGSTRR